MAAEKDDSKIARRRRLAQQSGDEDYRQRRAQLREVAGRVFREKGYEGASVADFAKAVGMDRASIYYYTSGKEELFREIVHEAVRDNVLMIEAIGASDDAPAEKVRAFVTGLMRSYARHYPYLYIYVQEDMARIAGDSSGWADEMRRLAERFDAASLAIVEQGVADGTIRLDGGSPQIIAFAIVGMCNWSHRWFRPTGNLSAERVGEQFADIVLNGIVSGGGAAARRIA